MNVRPSKSGGKNCLVRHLVHTVSCCAEGGDRRAKGEAVILAMIIYKYLEARGKELVREVVRCGEIVPTNATGSTAETQITII